MTSADWWARKLQQQQPQVPQRRPDPTPQMPPSQQPMASMPQLQQPSTERAMSARQTDSCPECGSANYLAVANAGARCYDCGYPIQQSGSKYGTLQGAHVEGSAKTAQGNDPTSNWNPQGIIGRIGE
jgi:hypothetical protein